MGAARARTSGLTGSGRAYTELAPSANLLWAINLRAGGGMLDDWPFGRSNKGWLALVFAEAARVSEKVTRTVPILN